MIIDYLQKPVHLAPAVAKRTVGLDDTQAPIMNFLNLRGNTSLPRALSMVTSTPASTVDLSDRGRIAAGLRGDLVRVHREAGVPVVRSVWRQGVRVA